MGTAVDKEMFDRVSEAFLILTKKFENLGREQDLRKEQLDQVIGQKQALERD